jgi:hypothetical protein
MTISFAPALSRFFSREAKTGCPSVGFAPMIDDHVGRHHAVEILRAGGGAEGLAEAIAGRRMAHPRAGVGVVVAEHGAVSFWTRKVSSLVQRLEVITPTDLRPYRSWMPLRRPAAKAIASSQLTSRQGSSIVSRIIGFRMRSAWLA